jgi:UDP-N-acetylglucosamine transferase subunit ALG13
MKIFVTVGSLFPFDRLISTVDAWSEKSGHQVVAQIGKTKMTPRHMEYHDLLYAGEYNRIFNEADLIISHAGMGVILKSLVHSKPLLVMPRKVIYEEVTTDHQLATARIYDSLGYINVAWDEQQLIKCLDKPSEIIPRKNISPYASEQLIAGLRDFIERA